MLRFPTKLPALWRQAVPAVTLGIVCGNAIGMLRGQTFSWPNTVTVAAVTAVLVLCTFVLVPIKANPHHLWLQDRWGGFLRRVAWTDVATVRHARWLFAPGLLVITHAGARLWLPRDTHNLTDLHRLATSVGGPEHPLVQAMEVPWYRL